MKLEENMLAKLGRLVYRESLRTYVINPSKGQSLVPFKIEETEVLLNPNETIIVPFKFEENPHLIKAISTFGYSTPENLILNNISIRVEFSAENMYVFITNNNLRHAYPLKPESDILSVLVPENLSESENEEEVKEDE